MKTKTRKTRKILKSKLKKGGNSIITINNESKKCRSNNNTGNYSTPETVIITDSYGNRMLPQQYQQQGCPTNPQTPPVVTPPALVPVPSPVAGLVPAPVPSPMYISPLL